MMLATRAQNPRSGSIESFLMTIPSPHLRKYVSAMILASLQACYLWPQQAHFSTTSTMSQLGRTTTAMAAACPYQARISKLGASTRPRVLVSTSGSGNFGEQGASAFWTIDELPGALRNMAEARSGKSKDGMERVDVDLGPNRCAFTVDHILSGDEADALAACAEAILDANGHSRVAPGINTPPGMRVNEAAHWYPSREVAPQFLGVIFDRIKDLVPQHLENGLPLYPRLSEKVAQFKYNRGDAFNRHVDGLFPGQGANARGDGVEEWTGVVSGFSMLLYLNDYESDGLEGGETRLWTADGSRHVDVRPKKGRALCFRRGSPNAVLHAGLPVTGDVPKYMALINLAYGEQVGTKPMMV